jgi:hypothetical protein
MRSAPFSTYLQGDEVLLLLLLLLLLLTARQGRE